jgi:dolichol-phosphate mannosyltransferase
MEKGIPDISIVVPIYNEQLIIPELHRRLKAAANFISPDHEIIFINDGSKDDSLAQIKALAARDDNTFFIDFSRNFGHQIAVTAGIDHSKGKVVVIIDGDLQDPPELIPELYARYREGYDVVYARRAQRKGETFFKKFTAKLFYRILKRITAIDIPVDTGDFRLMDRKVVDYLKQMPEQNKFLRGQIAWLGFRQTFVLFNRDERKHGKTGYSFFKMLHFAMDGITSFSDKPLLMVSMLGVFFSFVAFLIILFVLYDHFVLHSTITGWSSLIISVVFLGGIQLISIGIIGEYISRINKNTINRPLYIIAEQNIVAGKEKII